MRWAEVFGLSWFSELLVEWVLWYALLYAGLGLLIAQLCSHTLGIAQEPIAWALAGLGFVYGVRHDLASLREGPSRGTIMVIAYLVLSVSLMAAEVLAVLHYFPLKA